MCTHNLCFGAKLRKIGITCIYQFHYMYIKVGFRGFFIACSCFFPDGVYTGTHTKNCILKKKKSYIYMFVILVV